MIHLSSSPEMCAQTYGFLPCTTTVLGNLFLVLAYGFLNYKVRVTCLTAGSELLLEIIGRGDIYLHPWHVVTLLLPMIGALPDSLLVLASGLSGSQEKAQNQVLIAMGLLAGSTIFLLTLVWGTCVVAGKSDLGPNSVAIDSTDTKGFSLTGRHRYFNRCPNQLQARIMAICVLPFAVALFPKILRSHPGHRLAILLASVVSFLLVLCYCLFQYTHPWIQWRRLAYAKHKHVISGILKHAQMQALGRLLNDDGTPNENVIRKLFHKIDMDESRNLSRAELHALIIGINFEEIDFDKNDAVDKIMDDFDTSGNDLVEEAEFIEGMKRWINEAKRKVAASGAFSNKFINDYHARTREEHDQLRGEPIEISDENLWNRRRSIVRAVGLILVGTAIPAAFADPLVDAVYNLSKAARAPSFFVSFVVLPLVNSSSEAISAVRSMRKKKIRAASLTLSEVYCIVTVNNLMCLGMFLAVVYVRDITWDFSSELLIILLVCVYMGVFTSFWTTFPLWTSLMAYLLYPLSLVIVYILDYVFHWS